MGPTPTRTPTSTLGMRLSCNFVNVYTIANGHPRGDPREENRIACLTSRQGCLCQCRCPCRRRGMPAIIRLVASVCVRMCVPLSVGALLFEPFDL